jgi:hypothetical protein
VAGKRLYTEADVRALARGARLVLGPDTLATPSALDAAFELGIAVVRGDAGSVSAGNPGVSSAGSCGCGGACGNGGGCTWSKMLSSDATYVVVVSNGKASVARLTPSGPVPFA